MCTPSIQSKLVVLADGQPSVQEDISAGVGSLMAQLRQGIEHEQDAVRQHARQTGEENAMLSRLLEEKEDELQRLRAERDEQAGESFNLVERLEALEEADSQLETALAERTELRAKLSARETTIDQLEGQLRTLEEKHAAHTRITTEEVSELKQNLKEQDKTLQALRASQIEKTGIDELLNQERAERLRLEQRLKETKVELDAMEAQHLQDTTLRESMCQELLESEARVDQLRAKADETTAKREQAGTKDSTVMTDLRHKLATFEAQQAGFREQPGSDIRTTDALCHAVVRWARTVRNSEGVTTELENLERIQAAGEKGEANKTEEVDQMGCILGELQNHYEHCQPPPPIPQARTSGVRSEGGAVRPPQSLKSLVAAKVLKRLGPSADEYKGAAAPSVSPSVASPTLNARSLREGFPRAAVEQRPRRVTVQTPVKKEPKESTEARSPTPKGLPPDQEMARRRDGHQPKSIMKSRTEPSSQGDSMPAQAPSVEALDSTALFPRGLYSRPVVGGATWKEKEGTTTVVVPPTRSTKKRRWGSEATEAAVRKQLLTFHSQDGEGYAEEPETLHDLKRRKAALADEERNLSEPHLVGRQDGRECSPRGPGETQDSQKPLTNDTLVGGDTLHESIAFSQEVKLEE